jgi:HD-like signal output (HDOD) protein
VIEDFRKKVEETINFLPPLPAVMSDLIDAINSEDTDFRSLGRIIARDPSMTLDVLKIANSAFYGLQTKVNSIEQAVRMLGISEIASLCISCSTTRSLKAPQGVETVDLNRFWRHSVATGVIAKIVCAKLSVGRWDSLYLAGLIHDVGAVILDRFKHDVYKEVLELTGRENISVREAEEQVMGASHDTVGGWLMEKWKLPEVFVQVASYHHTVSPASDKYRIVVAIISLADIFARLTQHGFDGNMNGVIVTETPAFAVLEKKNPKLKDMDMVKLVWDLDSANNEINDMEKILGL